MKELRIINKLSNQSNCLLVKCGTKNNFKLTNNIFRNVMRSHTFFKRMEIACFSKPCGQTNQIRLFQQRAAILAGKCVGYRIYVLTFFPLILIIRAKTKRNIGTATIVSEH